MWLPQEDEDEDREVVLELQEYDHHEQLRWDERDVPGPPRPPRPRGVGGVLQLRVRNRYGRPNVSLSDRLELQGEDEATLRELLVRYRYNHGLAVH